MPFTSFIGRELLEFIKNADKIVAFLQLHLAKTEKLTDLCDALKLWAEISPFLIITKIDDINIYTNTMNTFKQNLNLFYKVGGRSFLTKDTNNIGGDETFYMHCLKFYMPMIAEVTLNDIKWVWAYLQCKVLKGGTKSLKIH